MAASKSKEVVSHLTEEKTAVFWVQISFLSCKAIENEPGKHTSVVFIKIIKIAIHCFACIQNNVAHDRCDAENDM